jgi:hypothetical protein
MASCKTPATYFNRPSFTSCIANGDGTAFCNGKEVDSTNMICAPPEEYDKAIDYFQDKEYRLFRCLKYGRCN